MNKYRKEMDRIIKALDLNKNEAMTYDELKSVLFNVPDKVFLLILSDMFAEGLLINTDDKYKLPQEEYEHKCNEASKKKQIIIDANKRLAKIREAFREKYYNLEDAQKLYLSLLNQTDAAFFETDMESIGYSIANGFVLSQFASVNDFLTSEILNTDIIDISCFTKKFDRMVKTIDIGRLLDKLKSAYQIIEFDKGIYINIKRLNDMDIYISDIRRYCSDIHKMVEDGRTFSIKSLRDDGFQNKLDDLGMNDIFYESLLKYDGRFMFQKMSNGYVFSIDKKPSIADVTYDVVKRKKIVTIYELQDDLKKLYGITTSFISESGSLINQSLLFHQNTTLFYSPEFEKIYFCKDDYYEEINYDE